MPGSPAGQVAVGVHSEDVDRAAAPQRKPICWLWMWHMDADYVIEMVRNLKQAFPRCR
jgi:hypothetical protein